MKKHIVYAITHGLRQLTYNPGHSELGIDQIKKIVGKKVSKLKIKVIGTGCGKRFLEISEEIKGLFPEAKVIVCNLLGCGDCTIESEGKIIVMGCHGKILSPEEYLSISEFKGFGWEILKKFPNGAIVCTGKRFIASLGYTSKSLNLYKIDVNKKSIEVI